MLDIKELYLKDYIFNSETLFISACLSGEYGIPWNNTSMSSAGLKPVISLRPNTEYTTGDGTTSNPYVIQTVSN